MKRARIAFTATILLAILVACARSETPAAESQPPAPVQTAASAQPPAAPDANELPNVAQRVGNGVALLMAPDAVPAPVRFSGAARAVRPEAKSMPAIEATTPADACVLPWQSNPTPPGVTAWRLATVYEVKTISTSVGVESFTMITARCINGSAWLSVTALPSGVAESVYMKRITIEEPH